MKNNLHLVSIVIPCRNEEKFIGKCIESVIVNDYPEHRLEVLVVDGMSEDGTRESIIIDGRNIYEPSRMSRLGFIYKSIGR